MPSQPVFRPWRGGDPDEFLRKIAFLPKLLTPEQKGTMVVLGCCARAALRPPLGGSLRMREEFRW